MYIYKDNYQGHFIKLELVGKIRRTKFWLAESHQGVRKCNLFLLFLLSKQIVVAAQDPLALPHTWCQSPPPSCSSVSGRGPPGWSGAARPPPAGSSRGGWWGWRGAARQSGTQTSAMGSCLFIIQSGHEHWTLPGHLRPPTATGSNHQSPGTSLSSPGLFSCLAFPHWSSPS